MMKRFSIFFALVAMLSSSVFSQTDWGWGTSEFQPSVSTNGLKIVLPISAWQLTNAPIDTKDPKMQSKRFPANAKITVSIYYAYTDGGKTINAEKHIKGDIDWASHSVTVVADMNLPSAGSFTVVGKVPGYNKSEGESVFIKQDDPYAAKDAGGNPVYRFFGDFQSYRVAKYKG